MLQDVEIQDVPLISWCCSHATLLPIPCGFYVVDPRTAVANVHCVILTSVDTEPGCHYSACCCREQYLTKLKQKTMEIPNAKVADGNGNPINISCIVNFRVVDPKKAILNASAWKNMSTQMPRLC